MATKAPSYVASAAQLRRALGPMSGAEVVLLAAQCLRVGSLDYASAVCEAWQGEPDPALELTKAAALFGRGEHASAVTLVDQVLARLPEHLQALFYRAQMAQHAGDVELARSLLSRVLERFPDFPGAQAALATLLLPGPPYREVLRRLHELVGPSSYLEIGVETGATLGLARAAGRVIGIDPDADALRPELVPPNARVFHETSDAFFAGHGRAELLGKGYVDLAFIDGMHLFEYALRDFLHVEAWSHAKGVIVLHDCLPVFAPTASRERRTKFWVGDVWKVVPILKEYRPELTVKVIATPPSGLCVVRGLNPSSTVLGERLPEIVERFTALEFPADGELSGFGFDQVPASEAGVREALR